MLAINALLAGGFTPERLKGLVDQGILVHQALAQASPPLGLSFAPAGDARRQILSALLVAEACAAHVLKMM